MRRIVVVLLAVAVVVAGAACSQDKQVGSDELLQFNEAATTTTAVGGVATTAAVATTAPRQTTAPPATQPRTQATAPAASSDFQLAITANGFDPDSFVVKVNQRIVFTNKDSGRAHSWVADNGAWDSGPLQPGEQFIYTARTVGVFDFKDEEVPFLIGRMEVRA